MLALIIFVAFFCLIEPVNSEQAMVSALDEVLRKGGFSASEIQQVQKGDMVKATAESTNERELAVKFAFVIKAPPKDLREMFMTTTKTAEKDPSVTQSGLITTGTLADFADIRLEPNAKEMTKLYLNAAPGTVLNLSKQEIAAWKAIKRGDGDKHERERVEQHLQQVLLDRYITYTKGGLKGLLSYARSGDKVYDPGQELKLKTEKSEILKNESPTFHKHLLEYPNHRPEGLEESFSWVNYNIDEKPTVVLIHRMGLLEGGIYLFSERHFYVSRSHNSVQGIGGFCPVEDGTLVAYISRTSTDQVAGFGSSAKRSIGARIMGGAVAKNFERVRTVEAKRSMEKLEL